MEKITRRNFLNCMAVGTTAAALSACGSDTASSGTTSTATSTAAGTQSSGEVKELSFWHYFSELENDTFNAFIDKFNETNASNIKVIPEYVPREELIKRYTMGAVSGDLPAMGMVDNPEHASFAAMGILADITEYYNNWEEANFLDGPIDSCTYDGKIWGLPQSSNCIALYYDIDLLAEANLKVPETWDDLEVCAKALTDPAKGQYGLAICAIGHEEGTFQLIPWLESAGSFDELNSPGSVSSLTFLNSLIENGYMSKEVINWNQNDVEKQFAGGSAAMMVNGPWNIVLVDSDAPDKNYGVVKVPRAPDGEFCSCLGGENFVICNGCDTAAAWEFLSWFCGKENSEEYTLAIKKFSPRADVDGVAQYKDDEKMAQFAAVMPTAGPRGPHPKWPEISAAIYTAEQEIFTGQKDAQTAMDEAQAKIESII